MKERFSKTQVTVARFVPSVLCTHSSISLEEVTSFYEDDLPSAALMSTEVWSGGQSGLPVMLKVVRQPC